MPEHSPEEITKLVDNMERDRADLHRRMDSDFDLYTLKAYQGEIDESGEAILDGYRKFTSNDPQTTMNLAMHLGSTAEKTVHVRSKRAQQEQRELDNFTEMYLLGILHAADERRTDLLMPSLQDALFAQCLFRGRWAQRVLLIKEDIPDDEMEEIREEWDPLGIADIPVEQLPPEALAAEAPDPPTTRTYVDITDWDPRNTYWAVGKHGLDWACNKSWKNRAEILAEYDVDPVEGGRDSNGWAPDEREYAVYDWFDAKDNQVVLEGGKVLKDRTPHGMGRVPVSLGMVGALPIFQAMGQDYEKYYGESFYRADRGVFEEQNFMYSVLSELSKRSIEQPLNVYSRDGSLSLPEDPRRTGTETSLSTDNQEDIKPLPPMEMVREAGTYMGIVSSQMQRGTFPATAFGELAFQLSGFAITQLRQGLEAPLTPHIRAVMTAFKQILTILRDAYASGEFDAMELSGQMQDPRRSWFSEQISPEAVEAGGKIEVDLIAQLPQDDATKVSLAQMLREGPVPLADDRFLREHILGIQDVEQMDRAVWEQAASRGSPVALAFKSMMAAAEQGDEELAQIWLQEMQIQMMTKMMELMMVGGGPQQPGGGGEQQAGRASLPMPQVAPPQMMGRRNAPSMQGGPNVPPGSPRPGAIRNSSMDVMGF